MRTVSAALVVCLNIGVDPPDIVRSNNCSKLECWISINKICNFLFTFYKTNIYYVVEDQNLTAPKRTLELIGAELQKQYERWQPRARYKQCLDPTMEDVNKLCVSLRRSARVNILLTLS
jgi:regulator-associated protein of mTOR